MSRGINREDVKSMQQKRPPRKEDEESHAASTHESQEHREPPVPARLQTALAHDRNKMASSTVICWRWPMGLCLLLPLLRDGSHFAYFILCLYFFWRLLATM